MNGLGSEYRFYPGDLVCAALERDSDRSFVPMVLLEIVRGSNDTRYIDCASTHIAYTGLFVPRYDAGWRVASRRQA